MDTTTDFEAKYGPVRVAGEFKRYRLISGYQVEELRVETEELRIPYEKISIRASKAECELKEVRDNHHSTYLVVLDIERDIRALERVGKFLDIETDNLVAEKQKLVLSYGRLCDKLRTKSDSIDLELRRLRNGAVAMASRIRDGESIVRKSIEAVKRGP